MNFMLIGLLALNFAISWFNCWSTGRVWNESRALGGWVRVLAWCGAIQAAIGFSSVLGFGIGAVLHATGLLPPVVAKGALSLWYLLIIIPALGTGLLITIESWIIAFRERSLLSMGGAAWNTFAQLHNMYGAIDGIGDAISGLGSLFDADDEGGPLLMLAVGIVVAALLGGVVLTYVLIRKYAGTLPVPDPDFREVATSQ